MQNRAPGKHLIDMMTDLSSPVPRNKMAPSQSLCLALDNVRNAPAPMRPVHSEPPTRDRGTVADRSALVR